MSSNGGASAYSASSASGTADNSAVGLIASIYQTKMNNDNAIKIAKMQNNNNLEIAKINAAASNYASNNSSSASKYASDNAYNASVYGSDVSYSGHKYGVDRTKYGIVYNSYQGVTGKSARGTGSSVRNAVKGFIDRVRSRWFSLIREINACSLQW